MNDILSFLRTSLVKNPEEWVFEDYFHSSGKLLSTMNLFFHAETGYVLILIQIPMASSGDSDASDLYYVQMIEYEEYLEALEQNEGSFLPDPEYTYAINSESVIVKTLLFIKNISIEDEQILRYSKFKDYIREKMLPKDKLEDEEEEEEEEEEHSVERKNKWLT
jgi:hypothetical protein